MPGLMSEWVQRHLKPLRVGLNLTVARVKSTIETSLNSRQIGQRLRGVITDLGYPTIDWAAKPLKITTDTLRRKTIGARCVSLSDVQHFADRWGCNVTWLCNRLLDSDSKESAIAAIALRFELDPVTAQARFVARCEKTKGKRWQDVFRLVMSGQVEL